MENKKARPKELESWEQYQARLDKERQEKYLKGLAFYEEAKRRAAHTMSLKKKG